MAIAFDHVQAPPISEPSVSRWHWERLPRSLSHDAIALAALCPERYLDVKNLLKRLKATTCEFVVQQNFVVIDHGSPEINIGFISMKEPFLAMENSAIVPRRGIIAARTNTGL